MSYRHLRALSFVHSAVYVGLLLCAFVAGHPEPATLVFGFAHGLLWIAMSLLCLAAARRRVLPYWLAVVVVVVGGLGPFAGTAGFLWASRRRPGPATG